MFASDNLAGRDIFNRVMPSVFPTDRLQRIALAESRAVNFWKEGISLERDSKKPLRELLCLVSADRWWLAYAHRRDASKLFKSKPQQYRSAVSRYYYSMYHAMRSCAFIFYEGDDHQEHLKLPLHIPDDFDPSVDWQNKLKDSRFARNKADYEAYPKSERAWEKIATTIKSDADLLLITSRNYLKGKGCLL